MSHLTAAQRGNIETLLQEKYTNKDIARKLGRSPSGIGRKIAKGLDGSGIYSAFVAQVAYDTNRKRSKQIPKLDHPANHRLSSLVAFTKLSQKTALLTANAVIAKLRKYIAHTITFDNIAWELNNKPRRRLQWHTPQEVYDFLAQHPGKPLDLREVAFGSRI